MATLPTPGGDTGTWGDELNTFLSVSLDSGGAIKNTAVAWSLAAPTQILGSPAASVTFAAIPATWTHLQLTWIGQTSDAGGQATKVQFNGDTSAIYDNEYVGAVNTTNAAAELLTQTFGLVGSVPPSTATAMPGFGVVEIPWYKATTFHKVATVQGGFFTSTASNGSNYQPSVVRWRSTAAITQIVVFPGAGNWVTGSSFALAGKL